MLKQSATRNQRYKGFKVKHVLQMCMLLAICIWLLNRARQSYDQKQGHHYGTVTSEKVLHEREGNKAVKLGRKDIENPQVQASKVKQSNEEVEEEAEETKNEDGEEEGRGGGDDEIDGRDQEKGEEEESEEIEDLIDEEDRDKENQIEDASLLEDQTENESEGSSHEHYKIDGADGSVLQKTSSTGTDVGIQRLRKLEEWKKSLQFF